MIKRFADLINDLGGAAEVARIANVTTGAVYTAKSRQEIPHRWRLPLYQEAERRQIKIDPTLLGMDT